MALLIEKGTPLFEELRRAFANPDTYRVRLAPLPDDGKLAVKTNEGVWTPPYDLEVE